MSSLSSTPANVSLLLSFLLCLATQVVLFDVQQRTALAELSTPYVKYVVWSADMSQVALLSKHAIIVADKQLSNPTTGARFWDSCSHFYRGYTCYSKLSWGVSI